MLPSQRARFRIEYAHGEKTGSVAGNKRLDRISRLTASAWIAHARCLHATALTIKGNAPLACWVPNRGHAVLGTITVHSCPAQGLPKDSIATMQLNKSSLPATNGAARRSAATSSHVAICALALSLICVASIANADDSAAQRVWLERHPDTALRVLTWNVARNFFVDNEGFQQVLGAIDADLLILDEMAAGASADRIARGLPAASASWQALYGTGGGPHQRASIAIRAPLERIAEFDQLAYPRERVDEWLQPVPADAQQTARQSLEAGVAAVGGVIEIQGRRILVVGLDLQCCGDSVDSPQEQRRQFEARAIRDAIDKIAPTLKLDGILVGGDFNAVQGDAPVTIMRRGVLKQNWLDDAEARHRGRNAIDWTWDGRGTPFASQRLDFLLHSDRLRVLQSQVFDSEDLSPEERKALNLKTSLSRSLSEHRPVVVDFGWR